MVWRPTKICEEYITMIDEYLLDCKDEWVKFKKWYTDWLKSSWESFEYKLDVNLPTYVWLLKYYRSKWFKINKDTLNEWKNKGKELKDSEDIFARFSVSLQELFELQEEMLLNWAISGKYNPIISKMLLNVNHGYKEVEKKEIEHSGEIKDTWSLIGALTSKRDQVVWKFLK